LTYGFNQIGDTTQAAVVPKGAELLIETRFPYLSADQLRVVLKTTALPSGYPVLDDAEGWGRLNLFDAADGYGAFNGDVVVTMDAGKGGFNAGDSWQNNISGAGKLTKQGSGTLKMTGANSYTGGTHIISGVLEADSSKAFGKGDVYLSGGTVINNTPSGLTIAGAYTQLANTTLKLNISNDGAGMLNVRDDATVVGGTLNVEFKSGYAPHAGSIIPVIKAHSMHGKFESVTVNGFKAEPIYTHMGLLIHIDKDDDLH
jgi:autotransporter-associated beta strand protein